MSWSPTPAQSAVLGIICGNRPHRRFSASRDPLSDDILVTVEGGLGGRRISRDGEIVLLTEVELQYAFGDVDEADTPRTPKERIAELREGLGEDMDKFSEDYRLDLRARLEELGLDPDA